MPAASRGLAALLLLLFLGPLTAVPIRLLPDAGPRTRGTAVRGRWQWRGPAAAPAPAAAAPGAQQRSSSQAATTAAAAARRAARRLQMNTACPAGCDIAGGGCAFLGTSGGYACVSCQGNLVYNQADGTCGCPAGWYVKSDFTCAECEKTWWCAGGAYAGVGTPARTACGGLLTTVGRRGTSIRACVNGPGSYYTVDGGGTPSAVSCPADTYSGGMRKQRGCVPCAGGYTTNGTTGAASGSACVLREGYFIRGPGEVALCAPGTYKSGLGSVTTCTPCATGVTTADAGATAEAACAIVAEGYYPETVADGVVKSAQLCPQKYYCGGGTPTEAFNVSAPAPGPANTVAACPNGTWTQGIGATAVNQCMTPPGFKTTGGATTECAEGEFRPGWVPVALGGLSSSSCTKCGDNIQAVALQQITAYAATPDATPSTIYVRGGPSACYIAAGQGTFFNAAGRTYVGVNCDGGNTYGAANTTYGLSAFRPCRSCGYGMQTSIDLPSSAQYWTSSGSAQGFTSPKACVTLGGFGFDGTRAWRCPAGSWNPAGTRANCTACDAGLSTPDSPAAQVSAANCTLAPGYGYYNSTVQPCPIGTFNDELRPNATAECTLCGTGLTTASIGSNSSADCV